MTARPAIGDAIEVCKLVELHRQGTDVAMKAIFRLWLAYIVTEHGRSPNVFVARPWHHSLTRDKPNEELWLHITDKGRTWR